MNQPLVSVIIPAHNSAHCIVECLDSVFEQTHPNLQVIVIDDGSDDDTWEVLNAYPNDLVLAQQENSGQGAARNVGISLASGAFITFLDADDFWLPDFLVRTVAFLEGNTEAIGVTCSYRLSRESDETFPQLDENDLDPPTRILKNFFEFWGKYDHVRTGTCLMRKSIVDQTEGQLADLRISQDLEYWAYFATFGKMGFIRDAMWVGNSRRNAAKSGWWRKYKKRRRMCPTVEQWLRRVESRLAENQRWGFEKVKGRVAMNYIHSMILAGRFKDARDQFREHGASLPTTIVWRIVSFSNRLGPVGWHLGCLGLQMRERGKSIRLALRNRKI